MPALPASFADGRYQVQRFLGEGAKKRVYLAHDTKLHRDVAIALIKTDGLDAEGLTRVRREAQAMGSLGDHPHIVTVFDIGDEDGQPFLIQECMAGGSLEELLERSDARRLPIEEALRIAQQICRALEHAHTHGIVHRDLKPGNIWLAQDGTARLGDFGLAVALDRSRLTAAGLMVGTVAYMPPEQALGGETTARADLYALGCVLYEMLTGRPPFLGDDAVAIISQHIHTAPVAPTWHNADVPRPLEALVLRLLEKDPAERPSSAAEVGQALVAIDSARSRIQESGSVRAPAVEAAAGPLYRRTFVGRETELRQLQASFESAQSGAGALVMVVGEPGIGKTSLCEQLATYASLRGGRTLAGHCYEEGSLSLPYLPFIEAMRSYVLAREPEELRKELGTGAAEVARIVSEVRDRVDVEAAPPASAEEERYRLLQAVTTFLGNAAAVQPIVIVLEDLHDADRGTLDLLTHLARNLGRTRLLVIGTYRDVEVDRAHPLANALVELRRLVQFGRIALRGLTADEVQRMLAAIAGHDVPWSLAEAVHRQTEGNPLFVQEVTRYLAEEGLVPRDGDRSRSTTEQLALSIPEGLRDVIGKRLSRLSDGCNRLLAIAAVAGREFALETLEAIAGLPEEELLTALEEAVRVGVLEERSQPGRVHYRFAHAFFRQSLYEELIAPRRIRLHQEVARALETQYAGRLEEHATELAEHYSYSSNPADLAKAVGYSEMAAGRASAVYAHGEAVRLLRQALEVQDVLDSRDQGKRCDLLLAMVEPGRLAGDVDGARAALFEAAELARATGDDERLVRAATFGVHMPYLMGVPDAPMHTLLTEAIALLDEGDLPRRARFLARLAMDATGSGDVDEGARLSAEAQAIGGSLDNPLVASSLLRASLATSLFKPQDLAERRRQVDDLERLAAETGDLQLRTFVPVMRATMGLLAGDLEETRRQIEQLGEMAQRFRLNLVINADMFWRAELLRIAGQFEEAADLIVAALEMQLFQWLELNELAMIGPAQLLLIRAQQGRTTEIEQEQLELIRRRPSSSRYARARSMLDYSLLGRLDECRRLFEEFAADGFVAAGRDSQWGLLAAYLCEACVALSDRPRAALLYPLLLPWSGFNLMGRARITTWFGPADRYLGLLCALLERWDDAERHFEGALEMCVRMPAPPMLAYTQHEFAQMLVRRSGPGDKAHAQSLLSDAAEAAGRLGMKALLDEVLTLRLELQGVSSTDIMTSIGSVAAAVQRERTDLSPHAAPDGTVTLMFTDIADSTPMAERLGDERWLAVIRTHNAIIREQMKAHGGVEVTNRGDGFMVAFPSPHDGIRCARAIQEAFEHSSRQQPEEPIGVRIGLHTGEPARDEDNFYGTDVNLAARIADDVAQAGQIVVSARLKELLAGDGDIEFDQGRELNLKGLSGNHRVFTLKRE